MNNLGVVFMKMRKPRPSQCILFCILTSTVLAVVVCLVSSLLLYLAPEEPAIVTYNGGKFSAFPALTLLVSAVLAVVASVIGCVGVFHDSALVLLMFAVCSLSVAGLELGSSGVVLSFTYTDEITMELTHVVEQEVIEFSAKDNDTYTMNKLQQKYACCGANNYSDWRALNTTWKFEVGEGAKDVAPEACCQSEFESPTCAENITLLHQEGCVSVLIRRLKPVVAAVFGAVVLAALLQVLTAITGCYGARLICRYRNYEIL